MSSDERNVWVLTAVCVVVYAIYLTLLFSSASGRALPEVPYAPLMLGTIGGGLVVAIIVSIAFGIAAGIRSPKGAERSDQRDREINRFGEYIGQSFVVIGGVATLILAMLEADHFWIANVVYLTFVLSAIVGSIAKIVAYRRGIPAW